MIHRAEFERAGQQFEQMTIVRHMRHGRHTGNTGHHADYAEQAVHDSENQAEQASLRQSGFSSKVKRNRA